MKDITICIGHFFIMIVAIWSAIEVQDTTLRILAYSAAIVSFTLFIVKRIDERKTGERIKKLEENHLSVHAEDETLILKTGEKLS